MDRIFYIILFFLLIPFVSSAQTKGDSTFNNQDTIQLKYLDSLVLVKNNKDTIRDTVSFQYNISKDAINDSFEWSASDLEYFDKDSNKMELYDSAFVKYKTISLKAGHIEFDIKKNEITGKPLTDSLNNMLQRPVFKDKKDEFTANLIRYNMKSKKGYVEYAAKKEGELTVHGKIGKFISGEGDSIYHADQMFIKQGLITNCTLDHPHWGIQASKIKLIPNKLAIFGVSTIQLGDVPLYPVILPFGLYPMFQGQKSGLILPKRLDYNQDFGVGAQDIGIYLVLSDYMDIRVTGDIYTGGTHGIHIETNYAKRYKYTGNLKLSYFNAIKEVPGDVSKISSPAFNISLSHNQSPKAHPYQKLGGNINFSLNGFQRKAYTDANNRINNITRSNFSYSNSLPGTPFNLSVALNHSQNNQTRSFDLTLPNVTLKMNTIYPFKSKNRVGKEKWYEKISLNYDGAAKNLINATDTTIFTPEVLNQMKYGIRQRIGTNATFRVFKYFNASFRLDYNEKHYFKTINKYLDPKTRYDSIGLDADSLIVYDTIYGTVIKDTVSQWKIYRHFSPSINISTNRYGKILFNKGWLRGIKHKITYNVSISGNPIDETKYYDRYVDTDTREEYNNKEKYSIFDYGGPFGTSTSQTKNLILNYNINNLLEAKLFSKKDSSLRKVPLLKNFSISGSYNITADSFNFSKISTGFNFSLFKNFISFRYSGSLDPYIKVNNIRMNKLVWDERKRPFRHDKSTLRISVYNKSFADIIDLFRKKDKNSKSKSKSNKKNTVQNDKLIDILKDFRLNYNLNMTWENNSNDVDTFFVSTHSIRVSGTIPITKNWKIRVNNLDYNLKDKKFEYPDFGFERDLHCWKMNFSWQPKGGSYTFFIGVKSSMLQFIKYQHGIDPIRANLNRGY